MCHTDIKTMIKTVLQDNCELTLKSGICSLHQFYRPCKLEIIEIIVY